MQVDPRDELTVRRILDPLVRATGARVVLFGSRARGEARAASDFDLALVAAAPLPADALAEARAAFEASSIPFEVDLVDYHRATPELRAAIDRDGVTWPI
ncbi:MAG: nucleotidyltransferase family protein [Casimicrobiaceae bacterium]